MSCKMVILAARADDTTHDECIEYMHEEHAPLVNDLPNLRRYTSSVPTDPEKAGYDYVAQLWFESPEEMNEAFESETGAEVQEDATTFLDMEATKMIPAANETTHYEAE
ncbi:EthD family reductase [Halorussus sp. MSC15.2]|uniref:EthD family reductase n=1 Tax=Halorussus sp. MSC15.2 TaxID=2283638 RepID=UPI0013D895F3|nr:EthD family reductase [Halorussus sp. MSC15.2]NEU56956.1 EthD family reductase [Halorussus sp. MSC15.2]